jgi:methylenetetrahydrofolate reductase (NADPH)
MASFLLAAPPGCQPPPAGAGARLRVVSERVKISELLRAARERGEPVFSFEFFPPRTDEGVASLFRTVEALRSLAPTYVCVTYGAGGSTRARTLEVVKRLEHDAGVEAMAHLTCVGSSRDEISAVLDELAGAGIENVMALRGDPPRGDAAFQPHPDGFRYASELVAHIRSQPRRWSFCLGAGAYPEGHVETRDLARDVANLKAKVDAGVDFLVTQLFFENAHYFRFVERARRAGIGVPILPGIMPVQSAEQVERMTRMCGATLPPVLGAAMDARREDQDSARELGLAFATLQCSDLLRRGAPGIHFYTLNRSPSTRAILSALRIAEPWRA